MKPEHVTITMASCLCLFAWGISLLSAALATTHWMVVTYEDHDVGSVGLFQFCNHGHCITFDDHSVVKMTDYIITVRVLCVSAGILYGVACFAMMIVAFQKHKISSKTIGKVCFFVSIVGGALAFGGVGHFVVKTQEDFDAVSQLSIYYGYSVHLAWASAIPVMIAGVMAILVVNHFFENRQINGQVVHGFLPPYAQNVAYPPGMPYPQALSYENLVVMSQQGPPSYDSSGRLGSGGTSNFVYNVPSYDSSGRLGGGSTSDSVYEDPSDIARLCRKKNNVNECHESI